jgi:nucleotide-binding universal stress UspA family protein
MKNLASTVEGTRVPLEIALGEGYPAYAIAAKAAEAKSDLIVIGTHGRSGVERLMLGSVTEKVLRKAGCPVLTVPPKAGDPAPAAPATFKRIVCAIDFSDCSMRALEYAMSLAQESNSTLIVLHVIEPFPLRHAEGETVLSDFTLLKDYIAAAEEEGRALLAKAIPGRGTLVLPGRDGSGGRQALSRNPSARRDGSQRPHRPRRPRPQSGGPAVLWIDGAACGTRSRVPGAHHTHVSSSC